MRAFVFTVAAALSGAALTVSTSSPVFAQSAWNSSWGANSPSDRQTVSFPTSYGAGEVVVSFGDRRLYHVQAKGRAISYPIGVPRAQDRWDGVERVSMKRVDPPWTPTATMLRENPKLPQFVPGGHPRNPLGVRAIYLGNTLYRIHGTDAPSTIGSNVSKGCVRMHNEHVMELYDRIAIGAKVTATWERFASVALPRAGSAASRRRPAADDFDPFGFDW